MGTAARPVAVTRELLPAFLEYCQLHGAEHDDSYTGDADLRSIQDELGEENPSVVLLSRDGAVRGAASAMLSPRVCASGRARFRILYCEEPDVENYRMLIDALASGGSGAGSGAGLRGKTVYLFVPEAAAAVRGILELLEFEVERISYGLKAPNAYAAAPELPEGFFLRALRPGDDEQAWCDIVNGAFAHLAGHTHCLPETVAAATLAEDAMPGGQLMLWDRGRASGGHVGASARAVPMGLVEVRRSVDEGEPVAQIGPIAVDKAVQGRGYGRLLLKSGMFAARQAGFDKSWLSVNGENERAISLYVSEGFVKVQAMVCYSRRID